MNTFISTIIHFEKNTAHFCSYTDEKGKILFVNSMFFKIMYIKFNYKLLGNKKIDYFKRTDDKSSMCLSIMFYFFTFQYLIILIFLVS